MEDIMDFVKILRDEVSATPKSKKAYYYTTRWTSFHMENMPEILSRLRALFPSYHVSHTILSRGKDGMLYDIARLTDHSLPLVETVIEESYIVVDFGTAKN
jgi:hypothetical protein